ncbi:MAG: class II glutamine amidotransferase [Rhodospirillales bacterium]|nr:class II glutamine amidotransferase [Rhodospirillales bacterium]
MCRLVAYSGAPVFLDSLLVHPPSSLIAQSHHARQAKTVVNGDGCGIGWYGERTDPGLYRGTLPAWSDANLVSLCTQIRARLFMAHVRSATFGEVATANCHPFSLGPHLFMHNGQIGQYATIRRRVDALIPDALYTLRRGTSDSEALFLAAAGRGLAERPLTAIAETLRAVLAEMRGAGVEQPLRMAAVHSDGTAMQAVRWASDGRCPSLYWRRLGQGSVVASEPFDDEVAQWREVPPGSALRLDPDGSMTLTPFAPAD